jgi:hypothetical protein
MHFEAQATHFLLDAQFHNWRMVSDNSRGFPNHPDGANGQVWPTALGNSFPTSFHHERSLWNEPGSQIEEKIISDLRFPAKTRHPPTSSYQDERHAFNFLHEPSDSHFEWSPSGDGYGPFNNRACSEKNYKSLKSKGKHDIFDRSNGSQFMVIFYPEGVEYESQAAIRHWSEVETNLATYTGRRNQPPIPVSRD